MHEHFYDLRSVRAGSIYAGSSNYVDVEVWDSSTAKCLGIVKNAYNQGAQRMIVTPDGKWLVTGRWEGGVSCYDVATAREIWSRDDICGVQSVQLSNHFPHSVFIEAATEDYRIDEPDAFDGVIELALEDGSEVWRDSSAHDAFLTGSSLVLVDRVKELIRFLDSSKCDRFSLPMVHFAVLDVDSRDGLIAVAEGPAGTRLVSSDGQVLSTLIQPVRESHSIRVSFVGDSGKICVYDNELGAGILVFEADGTLVSEYQGDWRGAMDFLLGGMAYVDGAGNVFDSVSGERW